MGTKSGYYEESQDGAKAVLERMMKILGNPVAQTYADALNVSPNTIKTWMHRGEVSLKYIQGFAKKHNVSVDYLLHGTEVGAASRVQNETQIKNLHGADMYLFGDEKPNHHVARNLTVPALPTAPDGFILVPRYEVRASAGNGALVHSEQIVDYLAFKADWVRNTLGVAQNDLALISVKGDSMEPSLSNDDLILVDMRKNRVEDNAIYVLQLDGTLLVKRIQHKLDGSLHVMSDNPRYEAEVVDVDRAAELHVLGRVVWSGRRM